MYFERDLVKNTNIFVRSGRFFRSESCQKRSRILNTVSLAINFRNIYNCKKYLDSVDVVNHFECIQFPVVQLGGKLLPVSKPLKYIL